MTLSLQCSTPAQPLTSTVHSAAQGQELHISYGKHSNDFLMVECESCIIAPGPRSTTYSHITDGFTMAPNAADHISVDHLILHRLSASQRQELEGANLLGYI